MNLSALEKIKSMSPAAKEKLKRLLLIEQHEADRRLEICGVCSSFDGKKCKICGCNMVYKVKLRRAKCADSVNQKW